MLSKTHYGKKRIKKIILTELKKLDIENLNNIGDKYKQQ